MEKKRTYLSDNYHLNYFNGFANELRDWLLNESAL